LKLSIPVSYEAFVNNSWYREWLFEERFGLPRTKIQTRDENLKYYDGTFK